MAAFVRTGWAAVAAEKLALAVGNHGQHTVEDDHEEKVHGSLH
jgi:hypothetical protein